MIILDFNLFLVIWHKHTEVQSVQNNDMNFIEDITWNDKNFQIISIKTIFLALFHFI